MTTIKLRGLNGGPKRTPSHLGDAWQTKTLYEVEQVIFFAYVYVLVVSAPVLNLSYKST